MSLMKMASSGDAWLHIDELPRECPLPVLDQPSIGSSLRSLHDMGRGVPA
jgi:hypothetical protein